MVGRREFKPWLIWILGALFYFYEFLIQVSPGVMAPELMHTFSITATSFGLLGGCYFIAYASMQLPAGLLLDNLGPRRLLTIATLICAVGSLIFGSSQFFIGASLGRFFTGLGSAFAALGCMHLAASWLPLKRFALMVGVTLTIGMLGAVGGQAPLAILISSVGWRQAMILFGIVGVILAVLIWTFVRDRSLKQEDTQGNNHKTRSFFSGLGQILSEKQTWLTAIYAGLMYIPTAAFGTQWGVPFISHTYQLDRPTAATIVSMLFIGWAIGAPFFGWLSDRVCRRRLPMFIGSIGTLISLLLILYVTALPLSLLSCLLFVFGVFSSGFLPAFSVAREINYPENNATALGFVNMWNMLGGAIAQPVIGAILDLTWRGAMLHGIRFYSAGQFQIALAILPISVAISLLLLPFVKETYCKPKYQIVRN